MKYISQQNRTNKEDGPYTNVMGFGLCKRDKNGGDSGERMGWQQEWTCIIFILWTSVQHSYLLLVYHLGG